MPLLSVVKKRLNDNYTYNSSKNFLLPGYNYNCMKHCSANYLRNNLVDHGILTSDTIDTEICKRSETILSDFSRASTRKMCPKQGPQKSSKKTVSESEFLFFLGGGGGNSFHCNSCVNGLDLEYSGQKAKMALQEKGTIKSKEYKETKKKKFRSGITHDMGNKPMSNSSQGDEHSVTTGKNLGESHGLLQNPLRDPCRGLRDPSLDGQNRAIVIAESLARGITAIRITSVRWRTVPGSSRGPCYQRELPM